MRFVLSLAMALILGTTLCVPTADVRAGEKEEARFRELRESMVKRQIESPADYREPVRDRKVLAAMRVVPRHHFVPPGDEFRAFGDFALPIGHGQTISQPYIVALMSELLQVERGHRVLEVGTGSGYQAAVLSLLTNEVYTIEIIEELALPAADRFRRLGYSSVETKVGDGYYGWREHAPFDRIIVTCAATLVPPPLIKQLKPGGKMCIPVGGQYSVQNLTMVEKSRDGTIRMKKILPVRFVPFVMPTRKE